MTKIYKHILLLVFIAWSTNVLATLYLISGAGKAEVNGVYKPFGINKEENPVWKHSDGSWGINADPDSVWMGYYYIHEPSAGTFNPNIPPFTGWEISPAAYICAA